VVQFHERRDKFMAKANDFTHKEDIDYYEAFSPMSKNGSSKIIVVLTAHFDLELYQIDVKITLMNMDLK
jgi:hypothetical protein